MKARILFPDKLGIYKGETLSLIKDILYIIEGILMKHLQKKTRD